MTSHQSLINLVDEVLNASYLMSLGTVDSEGSWVADVIFVHDDVCNVYWMSTADRRHSMAIEKSPNVAAAITVTMKPGDPDLGLQMSGVAEVIEFVPRDVAVRYFKKQNKPEPAEDFVVLPDHRWYVFCPTRIELIHEPLFGYDRQRVK